MQTQFKIMKWAVVKCPSVELKMMGESVPSLLDFGSMVSFRWLDHFNRYFSLQLGPAEGSVADAHYMFDLTSASGRTNHFPGTLKWMWNFSATGAKGQILDYPESKQGIRP